MGYYNFSTVLITGNDEDFGDAKMSHPETTDKKLITELEIVRINDGKMKYESKYNGASTDEMMSTMTGQMK